MDEGSLGLGLEERKKNGDPTGWYNYVVGGSITPVPTRAVIKTKNKREAKRREEKRTEKKRREALLVCSLKNVTTRRQEKRETC